LLYRGLLFLLGLCNLLWIRDLADALSLLVFSIIAYLLIHFAIKHLNSLKSLFMGCLWASVQVVFWLEYSGQLITQPTQAVIEGTICSIPQSQGDRISFDFCIDNIDQSPVALLKYNKVKLLWGEYADKPEESILSGDYWQLKVKLKPIAGKYNPDGFDYEKWMLSESYAGSGYVKSGIPLSQPFSVSVSFNQARQGIYNRLDEVIAESSVKGLLLALIMGERGQISDQQWDDLKYSGTSHLLAISGLHIGVAALWSYWLVLFLWRQSARLCQLIPAQQVASIASVLGALVLLLLSGIGLPAQRAFVMLLVYWFATIKGFNFRLFSSIGIALIIILLMNPFAVLSAGFWLSFIAVFIISLVIEKQVVSRSKVMAWLAVNRYLFYLMIPVSLLFFDMFSLVSFVANIILIPFVSFVLIPLLFLGLFSLLLSHEISLWLFELASQLMSWVVEFQHFLSSFNQSWFDFQISNVSLVLLFLIGFLKLIPGKVISSFIYLPILFLLILTLIEQPDRHRFELIVLDAGQGLAIYLETDEGNLVYDTGWGDENFATANSTLIPMLKGQQINRIDKLIISHSDADHAGGVSHLTNQFEIGEIISGEPIYHGGQQVETVDCHQYQDWKWNDVSFRFLPHWDMHKREGNDQSCVLSIDTGYSQGHSHGKILLTGDIEKQAELALISNGLENHEIVVAPHHGSRTSSTYGFVRATHPQHVIFSTGYDNRWGFPKDNIVNRYTDIGSEIWVTHRDGAILINLEQGGDNLKINAMRQQSPHFWMKMR